MLCESKAKVLRVVTITVLGRYEHHAQQFGSMTMAKVGFCWLPLQSASNKGNHCDSCMAGGAIRSDCMTDRSRSAALHVKPSDGMCTRA